MLECVHRNSFVVLPYSPELKCVHSSSSIATAANVVQCCTQRIPGPPRTSTSRSNRWGPRSRNSASIFHTSPKSLCAPVVSFFEKFEPRAATLSNLWRWPPCRREKSVGTSCLRRSFRPTRPRRRWSVLVSGRFSKPSRHCGRSLRSEAIGFPTCTHGIPTRSSKHPRTRTGQATVSIRHSNGPCWCGFVCGGATRPIV